MGIVIVRYKRRYKRTLQPPELHCTATSIINIRRNTIRGTGTINRSDCRQHTAPRANDIGVVPCKKAHRCEGAESCGRWRWASGSIGDDGDINGRRHDVGGHAGNRGNAAGRGCGGGTAGDGSAHRCHPRRNAESRQWAPWWAPVLGKVGPLLAHFVRACWRLGSGWCWKWAGTRPTSAQFWSGPSSIYFRPTSTHFSAVPRHSQRF